MLKACQPCRQRRRKCNGSEPCETCVGYGYDCHYNDNDDRPKNRTKHSNGNADDASQRISGNSGTRLASPTVFTPPEHVPPKCTAQSPPKGVIDAFKSRYVGSGSAISCPLLLSREFNSLEPLRLHSYAWNTGFRKDGAPDINHNLRTMMTLEDIRRLCAIYFKEIHPTMGFLDQIQIDQKAAQHWKGDSQGTAFEAIICGICTLGSLFGQERGPADFEAVLVTYAKKILSNISVINSYSIDYVSAWLLRTIYLRATTRPHASWMASSATMNMCEATGLHREIGTLDITSFNAVSAMVEDEKEIRRKIFWVAWSLNCIYSYEYARTRTYIDGITCLEPKIEAGDHTTGLIRLAKVVSYTPLGDSSTQRLQLNEALHKLGQAEEAACFVVLLEVEMGFAIYRRLRAQRAGASTEQASKVLSLAKASLPYVESVMKQAPAWWSVIGIPFQYACVCLATNTSESLLHLGGAMKTLEEVNRCVDTDMAKEALKTIRVLVTSAQRKKQAELDLLAVHTLSPASNLSATPWLGTNGSEVTGDQTFPEWLDNEAMIDWDQLFFNNVPPM